MGRWVFDDWIEGMSRISEMLNESPECIKMIQEESYRRYGQNSPVPYGRFLDIYYFEGDAQTQLSKSTPSIVAHARPKKKAFYKSSKSYKRKHAHCPFCYNKPLIIIEEHSERNHDVEYIRHFTCPYCGNKIELRMHEYYNSQNLFQRAINLRKLTLNEDKELKKKQRGIQIYCAN